MHDTLHTKEKKRLRSILTILEKEYPNYQTLLTFHNAYELLIAVILSAQTTDEQVNRVTPALFAQYPTPDALAHAPQQDVEQCIFTTGFYKNKAKNIIGAAKHVVSRFSGKVPDTMEQLTTLPGVGRKTAGVVLYHIFGKPAIIVDTHFGRLCRRLGLTTHTDPHKVETALQDLLPHKYWSMASMVVNFHGRRVCKSRIPECHRCALYDLCPNHDNAHHIK